MIGARISYRKWRENKQHLIWWPELVLLRCCLVSLYFRCDILAPILVEVLYIHDMHLASLGVASPYPKIVEPLRETRNDFKSIDEVMWAVKKDPTLSNVVTSTRNINLALRTWTEWRIERFFRYLHQNGLDRSKGKTKQRSKAPSPHFMSDSIIWSSFPPCWAESEFDRQFFWPDFFWRARY